MPGPASWPRPGATISELTGKAPPTTPDEIRAWLAEVAGDRLATWPRSETGELSIERKHLKRLALSDDPDRQAGAVDAGDAEADLDLRPEAGRVHQPGHRPHSRQLQHRRHEGGPVQRIEAQPAATAQRQGARLPEGDCRRARQRAGRRRLEPDRAARRRLDQRRPGADRGIRGRARPAQRDRCGDLRCSGQRVTKAQRAAAKAVNFGSIYGIGAALAGRECLRRLRHRYDRAGGAGTRSTGSSRATRRCSAGCASMPICARRRGYVEIGVGRVVEARWEAGGRLSFQQCCNLPVQGAAADAMLRAIAMVFRRLRGIRGGLVASVHDELLLEVAEDDAEQARQILAETMIEAFELTFPGAPTHGWSRCRSAGRGRI